MEIQVPSLLLVRHGPPAIKPGAPAETWHLSADGRTAVRDLATRLTERLPAHAVSSPEPKAVETAALLGLDDVRTDERLREVERPSEWSPTYAETALTYLGGTAVPDWEPITEVATRVRQALSDLPAGAVVVGHGISLSLLVSSLLNVDAKSFWRDLRMPDAWVIDVAGLRRL